MITALGFILVILQACTKTEPTIAPGNGNNSDPDEVVFDSDYQFYESDSKVQDRNFYLFSLLEKYNIGVVNESSALNDFRTEQDKLIRSIGSLTESSPKHFCDPFQISDGQKILLNNTFEGVVESSTTYTKMVEEMRSSGAFIQFKEVKSDVRYFQLALGEAIEGINNVIEVYGLGEPPLYPDIDSGIFDVASTVHRNTLQGIVDGITPNLTANRSFIYPSLTFALELLEVNTRDESGRYFPMQSGVNRKVFDEIPDIKWEDYDYAIILVLGDSPNSAGDLPNISLGGMKRADHGVKLWREGLAPVIAFSGGHLHPVQTPYSEAIEMKKYIMEEYNVPEEFILVDPHARHTTTNLRNVGRLIFRYGIPSDKLSLVSTSESHSEYVGSDRFKTRSINEMNHIPCVFFDRLSGFDLEFKPTVEVLHLDSTDPLDP
jgi:hypothetical protein